VYGQEFVGLPDDPHISVPFGEPGAALLVSVVRLEVKNLLEGDVAQTHVRDIALQADGE
jgi:hypothetical protein